LNAIAAVQQALYQTLEDLSGRDRLQSELYNNVLEAAKQTGYLSALNAETDLSELETLGKSLDQTLAAIRRETTENQARQAKEARKQAALSAISTFFVQHPTLIASATTSKQDRDALLPLLDECIAAGIPPSNVQIRNALLVSGIYLLEGLPKYSRILDAVITERQRRGIDGTSKEGEIEENGPSESVIEADKELVRLFAEDQRILILGGVPRQRVCEELKEALNCTDIKWLESKKSDKAMKFQTEIKKTNILLLLKNFAGHDMSEKGREWIKSTGGHFIYLPGGYGVNQIIHQLHKYVLSRDTRI